MEVKHRLLEASLMKINYQKSQMNWLFLFLTTMIGLTESQTLVSYSECPMVDQLLLKTFEETIKLETEIANLREHVDNLHRNHTYLEKLFKSILIKSKCHQFTFGLECKPCPCIKNATENCDYETGRCKCKPGFYGELCDCVTGQHQCNLTSSYCSYYRDGSPGCFCRDGFRWSKGCSHKCKSRDEPFSLVCPYDFNRVFGTIGNP